jgi:hypothetical protein
LTSALTHPPLVSARAFHGSWQTIFYLLPPSLSAYHTTLTVPYYAETCLSFIIHHADVIPKAIGAILACSVIM